MNICVVGTGYVGLVTGSCFADFGLNVVCVDKDKEKIRMLNKGKIPIYEPGLGELIKKNEKAGRLSFSSDISRGIKDSLVIFIAVGTPSKDDGSADLSYVKDVARNIAKNLNGYKVIVTKSTVPVGTGKFIGKIIKDANDGDESFDIASNPEFLREGSAIEDFMRPNRVVLGANSKQAIAILKDLYSPLYLLETPFIITNVETAEMIKYASNAFLATKISFVNEMSVICEKVGADINMVAKGMGLDKRIGSKFLHPGPGYGGSCFPKDTLAIAKIAREHGLRFEIVESAIRANEKQRKWMVDKIRKVVGCVDGKTIGILGLTFKPNTDDTRESPAVSIISALLNEGAVIRTYDPAGMENAKLSLISDRIYYGRDAYDVSEGCDAVVIVTEWNQFRMLDLGRLKGIVRSPVLIDLRNIYEASEVRRYGFKYESIGRY